MLYLSEYQNKTSFVNHNLENGLSLNHLAIL